MSSITELRRPDPLLAVIWAVLGGPLLVGIAFMIAYSIGLTGLLSHGLSLSAWRKVLVDPVSWVTLGFSFWIGAASLGSAMAGALFLELVRPVGATSPRLAAWYLPIAVPPIVAALSAILWISNSGFVARIAYALHWIDNPGDFPSPLYARSGLGIIVTQAALVLPFLVLLFDRLGRLHRVHAIAEVARTLGASPTKEWIGVRAPILLRAAMPALSVYFLALSGAFEIPLLVGAQYPATLSVRVAQLFSQFDLSTRPEAYALALLWAILVSMCLILIAKVRFGQRPKDDPV